MIGRLRRIRCTYCPMPMEAVSPSPLTLRAIKVRLASTAPVATEGMRPCAEFKLWAPSLYLRGSNFFGDRSRVERQAVQVRNAAEFQHQFRFQIQLEQAEHLGIAILFHYVNPFVLANEVCDLRRKGKRSDAQIV